MYEVFYIATFFNVTSRQAVTAWPCPNFHWACACANICASLAHF